MYYDLLIIQQIENPPLTLIHFSVSINWAFSGTIKINVYGKIDNIAVPVPNQKAACLDSPRRHP